MNDKKIKIGIVCICLNPPYWSFIKEMIDGLNRFFLKKHDIRDKYETEMMVWSDIPDNAEEIQRRIGEYMLSRGDAKSSVINDTQIEILVKGEQKRGIEQQVPGLLATLQRVKVFHTDPVEWPMPTLLRYNLFLQQEEYLKQFDYVFYIDVDMRIVDWVGEEIFGDGLTAAQHPMYAVRRNLIPPYEDNPNSTAYIPRLGRIIQENGKTMFEPLYYAGGFQGGKTQNFIDAMKVMKSRIEKDFNNNYIARWNDESHWNRYLYEVPPAVVLNPSYIYPDSMIDNYYVKVWGRNYSPKIMTVTKSFSTTKTDGAAIARQLATM